MSFTHRMAGLVAVVAVPLGIAATSYALTDEPDGTARPARRAPLHHADPARPAAGAVRTGPDRDGTLDDAHRLRRPRALRHGRRRR
ncbi:hypothetical protein SNE510_30920 [Streptomyces sp. NE5-10]|uniref:small hydrophilic protein n=1 Tax=Streptomyces sp. NE5-10 TaxID=2759674 RepID=UPI001A3A5E17|nr:small hydrophilic protein [Streptomyces sp. NE5-10]GHJ93573.1 hypothetical protein SNE510_30920 [Streptomyces sp. NE5-10]